MDIITRISRQRGKMQIVISEQETIVVPLSLFRERPLTEGQPINLVIMFMVIISLFIIYLPRLLFLGK